VDDLWATKSEEVGLIVSATNFQDFQQTDGQTTCNRKTALCTIVHRAVKTRCTPTMASSTNMVVWHVCWQGSTMQPLVKFLRVKTQQKT